MEDKKEILRKNLEVIKKSQKKNPNCRYPNCTSGLPEFANGYCEVCYHKFKD